MTEQPSGSPFMLGPEDATVACLLMHGFSGNPAEMRGLGESLARQGFRVLGIAIAGHNGEPDELAISTRTHWIASAEAGLQELANYPTIFLVGLSMGGVLSLHLAIHFPQHITGVIALSTPTRFNDGFAVKLLPVARYLMKWFYPLNYLDFSKPKVQAEVLRRARETDPNITIDFSNPEVVAFIKRQVRLPIRALDELVRLTNATRRKLAKVHSPLLIIHSKRDQTVKPVCAEELLRLATSATPKRLHWLQESDHVITTGPEREEVYQLTADFIMEIVGARAGSARPEHAPLPLEDGSLPDH